MEFTSADIFQHSPLGDVLNSLKSLSLLGDSWPNHVRLEWEANEFNHLIATVDDLTDMLDFDSEDIDGMDDDAGEEQEPPPTGRWTATSSYDIYMADTPKESNGDEATEENLLEKQSKRRRQRRRSKPCHSKNSDTGTRDNNPDGAEDENNPAQPGFELADQEDGQVSPKE